MSLTKKARTIITAFLVIAAIAVMGSVGLYFFQFGPDSGYVLSKGTSDWAQFGDYLAGTLGPLFSLLAFVGVLCTVWLQASQIESAQRQSALDEIQRVLSGVAGRIDEVLAETVNHQFASARLQAVPATFFRVLSSAGTGALAPPSTDYMRQALTQRLVEESQGALQTQAQVVGIELDQLCWLLGRYQQENGAEAVLEFYRRRYSAVICWLDALGFLPAHPEVQREFDLPALREVFRSPPQA